jgi:transcriptional regulator with XRE-family HTH domain
VAEQGGNLDTYDELADLLVQLPLLMREARRARGLRMRDVGQQVGMSASTICRIEAGGTTPAGRPPMPVDLAEPAPDPAEPTLLDLAGLRLADLGRDGSALTVLAAVMRRLFDPRERDLITVSAFGSAL